MSDNSPDEQQTIAERSDTNEFGDNDSLLTESRHARIAAYDDVVIGVCLYLTVSDLRALGIDIHRIDAEAVEYTIDGDTRNIEFRPLNR